MRKIVHTENLGSFTLRLTFDDGVTGACNLSHLVGRGVFGHIKTNDDFASVRIGSHGELIWPGDIDLCPDALYLKVTEKTPDSLFPALSRQIAHA